MTNNTIILLIFTVNWTIGLGISALLYIYWLDVNSNKPIIFKKNEIATDNDSKNFILDSVAANNQRWVFTLITISFFWLPLIVVIIIKNKK